LMTCAGLSLLKQDGSRTQTWNLFQEVEYNFLKRFRSTFEFR
jgi:hypothetical protein